MPEKLFVNLTDEESEFFAEEFHSNPELLFPEEKAPFRSGRALLGLAIVGTVAAMVSTFHLGKITSETNIHFTGQERKISKETLDTLSGVLKVDADLRTKTFHPKYKFPATFIAMRSGANWKTIKALLDAGVDPNARSAWIVYNKDGSKGVIDCEGPTLLFRMVCTDRYEMALSLLNQIEEVDPNCQCGPNMATALQILIRKQAKFDSYGIEHPVGFDNLVAALE